MGTAQDILCVTGEDEIISRVEDGEDIKKICKFYGVGIGAFYLFMNANEERAERFRRAKETSAEALLEKGREVLESALKRSSGIDPQAAKALASEYARLAAIRNPSYSDKPQVAVQINNNPAPLQLPDNADPMTASRTYAEIIGGPKK